MSPPCVPGGFADPRTDAPSVHLTVCARCKKARYCGKACQMLDGKAGLQMRNASRAHKPKGCHNRGFEHAYTVSVLATRSAARPPPRPMSLSCGAMFPEQRDARERGISSSAQRRVVLRAQLLLVARVGAAAAARARGPRARRSRGTGPRRRRRRLHCPTAAGRVGREPHLEHERRAGRADVREQLGADDLAARDAVRDRHGPVADTARAHERVGARSTKKRYCT